MKFITFLLFISALYSQPKIPLLKSYANDFTNTLNSSEINVLNSELRTFEDSTTNQLVMLMIPALNGYPIEEFANETAEKNKIGTKKNDNGILLLIVKNDRKVRIEVGYGLEGAVPDALASSIVRNVIIPYFKKDDYFNGIRQGIHAIILASAGEYKAIPKSSYKNDEHSGIITLLMIIFFIVSFFLRGGRRGRGGFIYYGGFGGGSQGGSSGFGGGGFSGGGGSFGGGGASGSW